jgi:ribonuclease Z
MMAAVRTFSEMGLVNGSTGDPVLFVDYPGKDDAFLFDGGDNARLPLERLRDLQAVFLTHFHIDHFAGFDRVLRANLDADKTLFLFGPETTIERVYRRIKAYDIQHFPFQKLVISATELLTGRKRTALLDCREGFPPPQVKEEKWKGSLIYENANLTVEAAPTDHTCPGIAYALVERTGYHPDPAKLAAGALRPGSWVEKALTLLRSGAPPETELTIDGGKFTLGTLGEQYFAVSKGSRIAYVTDTAWSAAVQPGLLKLAKNASRLYCDSYYAHADLKRAGQYRHMTATHTAEFATRAKVDQLILMHFAPRYAGKYEALVEEARAIFPRVSADLRFAQGPPA